MNEFYIQRGFCHSRLKCTFNNKQTANELVEEYLYLFECLVLYC